MPRKTLPFFSLSLCSRIHTWRSSIPLLTSLPSYTGKVTRTSSPAYRRTRSTECFPPHPHGRTSPTKPASTARPKVLPPHQQRREASADKIEPNRETGQPNETHQCPRPKSPQHSMSTPKASNMGSTKMPSVAKYVDQTLRTRLPDEFSPPPPPHTQLTDTPANNYAAPRLTPPFSFTVPSPRNLVKNPFPNDFIPSRKSKVGLFYECPCSLASSPFPPSYNFSENGENLPQGTFLHESPHFFLAVTGLFPPPGTRVRRQHATRNHNHALLQTQWNHTPI